MATSEERIKILRMLEEGKINAEEASRLLRALTKSKDEQPVTPADGSQRWLRVRVTDLQRERTSVNVNLPMDLVNVGLRMGARFSPEMEGLDLDEISEALRQGLTGKIVDVIDEEEGQRVEVYVE
jgi:hypothetical protein